MELLFHAIQEGKLTFPEDRWQTISPDAKQIVSRNLLLKSVKLENMAKHGVINASDLYLQWSALLTWSNLFILFVEKKLRKCTVTLVYFPTSGPTPRVCTHNKLKSRDSVRVNICVGFFNGRHKLTPR